MKCLLYFYAAANGKNNICNSVHKASLACVKLLLMVSLCDLSNQTHILDAKASAKGITKRKLVMVSLYDLNHQTHI